MAFHPGTNNQLDPPVCGKFDRAVWAEEPLGLADQNTVSVHIHRLRAKIEPYPAEPQYLVTVRGLGYKLVQPTQVVAST